MSTFSVLRDDWPTAPPVTPKATRNRPSSNSCGVWTDEKFELAKKLWQDGLSAADVAGELGSGFTRSAVLGKLHRSGASARSAPIRIAKHAPPRKAAIRPELRPPRHKPQPVSFKKEPPMMPAQSLPVPEILFCPTAPHVTIHELTEHTCRFPVSDDPRVPVEEFFYCGALTDISNSYCSFHLQLSYTRVPPRNVVHARPRA